MTLTDLFTSDPALSLVAGIAGTVWAAVQSSSWFSRLRRDRVRRALRCIESAVRQVYEEYVRAIKAASADGTLTGDERRRARELARDRAVAIARTESLDLVATLGREHLDLWIERVLARIKRA
jgi:hypothetical protein